jgi:MFS family permease
MPSTFFRNAIVLGLLTAIGPFAIDMYLPALPAISAGLNASTSATQATLMAFFVAFGICQIAYGPVSDMYGRKPPLYAGLCLFVAGSIGCLFCPTIGWLIGFRFIQGVGASAVMVIPRAVIRDLHTGLEATRLMSLVMLVFSVSPILAPLIGSALIVPFGWPGGVRRHCNHRCPIGAPWPQPTARGLPWRTVCDEGPHRVPIDAKTLIDRLPATLVVAEYRERKIYGVTEQAESSNCPAFLLLGFTKRPSLFPQRVPIQLRRSVLAKPPSLVLP